MLAISSATLKSPSKLLYDLQKDRDLSTYIIFYFIMLCSVLRYYIILYYTILCYMLDLMVLYSFYYITSSGMITSPPHRVSRLCHTILLYCIVLYEPYYRSCSIMTIRNPKNSIGNYQSPYSTPAAQVLTSGAALAVQGLAEDKC